MATVRCPQGHSYDSAKHTSCPRCGVPGITLDTEKKADGDAGNRTVPLQDGGGTKPLQQDQKAGDDPSVDQNATIAWNREKLGIVPVVGWLVCVAGPERGRDYRIRNGQNSIGRAQNMDICIRRDDMISAQQHAFLSYDPRGRQFRLRQGTGSGLVYLNDELVEVPTALQAYDRVRLGETELVFIPFCGEKFQWQDD